VSIRSELDLWLEKRPLIFLRLVGDQAESWLQSARAPNGGFTVARPHSELESLNLPTLCLVEVQLGVGPSYYIGVAQSSSAVTTFDSRLIVKYTKTLELESVDVVADRLSGNPRKLFRTATFGAQFAVPFSPKASIAIIDVLCSLGRNLAAIERAASRIPGIRKKSASEWQQFNAITTAMIAFGLKKSDSAQWVETYGEPDSTLAFFDTEGEASLLEDNVINKDASVVPGYALIQRDLTGLAIFRREDGQVLKVYTANRGPLEKMLGVDLIYVNETMGNTLMLQYKMLEASAGDRKVWEFRPDRQMQLEVDRMKLAEIKGVTEDYRLHRDPFFFKLVKRKTDQVESAQSYILSLDHLRKLLVSPRCQGPRGGVRIDYDSLGGSYLRETHFIGLLQSGYIGTHRIETQALDPILAAVAKGDRAVVLAWQRQILQEDTSGNSTWEQ